jgi:hypothetical protein
VNRRRATTTNNGGMMKPDFNLWAGSPRSTWPPILRTLGVQFHSAIVGASVEQAMEDPSLRDQARGVIARIERRVEQTGDTELRSLAQTLAEHYEGLHELGVRVIELRNEALQFRAILEMWPDAR